ncbi:tubulin binding cofactor A [Chytriomyces sp. MP71]|nr:tubulin binding cofactor A [Chytriomyces sp. MP71]
MLQASTRTLKIKTGVVTSRLVKELNSYEKEAVTQQKRIDSLVAANEDDHTVRKQREVLEETTTMIPDCKNRLLAAREDLQKLVADILVRA